MGISQGVLKEGDFSRWKEGFAHGGKRVFSRGKQGVFSQWTESKQGIFGLRGFLTLFYFKSDRSLLQ